MLNRRSAAQARNRFRKLELERLEDRLAPATFTVINTNDSGAGSLRQAILDANAATLQADQIIFNIPVTDPGHVYYRDNGGAGVSLANITPTSAASDAAIGDIDPHWNHSWWQIKPASLFPDITDALDLNGYSQPGASVNTLAIGDDAVLRIELVGSDLASSEPALNLSHPGTFTGTGSDGSTIRGLVVNTFKGNAIHLRRSNGSTVAGNFVGSDVSGTVAIGNGGLGIGVFNGSTGQSINTIGGSDADRNLVVGPDPDPAKRPPGINARNGIGLAKSGATDSNVIRNNYIGLNAAGTALLGVFENGISISGATNTLITANVVAGASVTDIAVGGTLGSAGGTKIQGNLVGTNAAGTASLRNEASGMGIDLALVQNILVGGPGQNEGNVIAGHSQWGIQVRLDTSLAVIQGNFIGTNKDGANLGNGLAGIFIDRVNGNNTVGGAGQGEGNVIAFNGYRDYFNNGFAFDRGVIINGGASNSILGNRVYGNRGIGIDLRGSDFGRGVTPNDAGDADSGSNHLQNFPEFTSIQVSATQTVLQGTLDSTVGGTFRIEFFASGVPGPDGRRDPAETILGVQTLTDSDNDSLITFDFPVNGDFRDRVFTATATNIATGDTSEFTETELRVTKTVEPAQASPGDDVTYTINVINGGPVAAFGVALIDTLPANVTFVSASSTQGTFAQAGSVLTFDVGAMASGAVVTATIFVRPTIASSGTRLVNSAVVSNLVPDPDLANNTASAFTDIFPLADLVVTKVGAPNPVSAGSNLTYTIEVTNNAADGNDAHQVLLSDTIPAGTTFVSFTPPANWMVTTAPAVGGTGTVSASIGVLPAQATATFTLVVNVNGNQEPGTHMSNTANVLTGTTETNSQNNFGVADVTVAAAQVIPPTVTINQAAGQADPTSGSTIQFAVVFSDAVTGFSAFDVSLAGSTVGGALAVDVAGSGTNYTVSVTGMTGNGIVVASILAGAAFDGLGTPSVASTSTDNTVTVTQPTATTQRLTLTLVAKHAAYRNELGLFVIDDASGRIGALKPGVPGYAAAALARRQVIFSRDDRPGTVRQLTLPAGALFAVYLVQNRSSADFLASNLSKLAVRRPQVFISIKAANSDRFQHVRWKSANQFGFEDMTGGGDRDFNDLVARLVVRTV